MRVLPALAFLAVLLAVGCRRGPPPITRPLFPMATAWTAPLTSVVEGPLAFDAATVYVATRDGVVRGVDAASGRTRWRVEDRPGVVSAGDEALAVRAADGTVWRLDKRTGATRWKAASGVAGTLPSVLYKDVVVAAGEGLAVLDAATGRTVWSAPEVRATAVPLPWGERLLVGEADGALRCRDLATGAVLWTYTTARPPLAPPVVDDEGRVLFGTTDRQFVSLDGEKGRERWSWRVGADVQAPPIVAGPRVLFATHEDVLYALQRGSGNLAWRASLPSRPLSGPLPYAESVLVACFGTRPGETFLIGFDARTGARQGDLKAAGEVRTPPVIVGDLVVMALRERALTALRLGDIGANP
ncbi:MAG TPA: PQQ-binding-like beta-propeller repeat protein [Vicinamibacteria bacterium]|nr:PQQ-binding-like beta-propeller repeat protein [Vicinamibacteria bacterium]